MKLDWKKDDRRFYAPAAEPGLIEVPEFGFFAVEGACNPDSDAFAGYVQALYSLSYAVKMSPKKGRAPEGYREYSVFPLEGVWDFSEEARRAWSERGVVDKDGLVFDLMIRQPDFVTPGYAEGVISEVLAAKGGGIPALAGARFMRHTEGTCVQMLHVGPYADEPASFARMEEFAASKGLRRLSKTHREIYMSDPRRGDPAKLKTVLRFRAG